MIPFLTGHAVPPGTLEPLAPAVQRLQGDNPGPFTDSGTGVFILGEGKRVMVIDPGPDSAGHREALTRALAGREVSHILVTHHHLDHTAVVPWLAERHGAKTYGYGVPRCVSKATEARLEAGDDPAFAPDIFLRDGETIQGDGITVEALHTPGHASNHMCYVLRSHGMSHLFCGDHVMGWSTSVVSPPDGHMGDYIAQLIRVRDHDFDVLHPTHGHSIERPRAFLDAYIAHRRAREDGVLACVHDGVERIPDMVARIYPDLNRNLVPAANLNVLAHLITLREEGRVEASGPDSLRCRYHAPRADAAQ